MINGMTPEYAAQLKASNGEWYFLNADLRVTRTPNLARWFNSASDAQTLPPSQYDWEHRIVVRYVTEPHPLEESE